MDCSSSARSPGNLVSPSGNAGSKYCMLTMPGKDFTGAEEMKMALMLGLKQSIATGTGEVKL